MSKTYTVLVVDDEKIILEGLVKTYPWEKAGLSVCGTALSGESALEKCQELHPDIIMTDIRMKTMDGLELIRQAKKKFPGTEFVVISAYRDFEYAQTACTLDVFSYLLKPFSDDDFLEVMTSLYEYLEQKRQKEGIVQLFERNKTQILGLELKQFLLYGKEINDFSKKMDELGCGWTEKTFFSCICLDIDETVTYLSNEDWEIYRYAQLQIFIDLLNQKVSCVPVDLPDKRMLLAVSEISSENGGIHSLLKKLMDDLESDGYANCYYVAHGQSLQGYEGLKKSFEQAVFGIQLAYEGSNLVEYHSQAVEAPKSCIYPKEQEEKVLTLLRMGKEEELEKSIQEFHEALELSKADALFLRMAYQQLGLAIQFWFIQLFQLGENALQAYGTFLSSLKTIPRERLPVSMTVMIRNLMDQVTHEGLESSHQYFEQAVSYIRKHLGEAEMTIADVASALHLNPVYFGRVFKKKSKKSFREYLLQCRMEKACDLFHTTSLSVTDIAFEVGMENLSYFSSQFRKYTGVLPSEYRR